ncbi:MAG: hypothetical protein ABI611_15030 [Solirubrobacteraceae bacterium]
MSRPHTFIDDVSIAFVPNGAGLIGWRLQDGAGAGARDGDSVVARSVTGRLGPERRGPRGRSGDLVPFGRSSAAAALVRPVGSNRDPRSELRVAFGNTAGGDFRPSRSVVRHPRIAPPAFAGNARGDLALAWFEDRPGASDRVEVALRRPGGSFGAPLRLATGRVRSVSAAVGPRGDVLVAWDARGRVRTRLRRAGSRRFGCAETLRSSPTFSAVLRTAVASSGRAYVAWSAQLATEGGDTGPVYFEAAVRPAGAARFRRAQRLEKLGPERRAGVLDLALTGHGNAVVAWTADRVRAAATDASGRFGSSQDLSPPTVSASGLTTASLTDVAAAPDGARVAVWTAGSLVQAAYAGPGAPFGPPEDIGVGDAARAAFPRAGAGPVVVWRAQRGGRTLVQQAARSG